MFGLLALSPAAQAVDLEALGAFSWTPATPQEGTPVRFTPSSALLVEGATLRWDFGDGAATSETRPLHSFPDLGVFTVRLDVTFPSGETRSFTQSLTVVDRLCGDAWRLEHEAPAPPGDVRAVAFAPGASPSTGFAVGDTGTLLRHDGQRWALAAGLPIHDYTGVAFASTTIAYAVASDGAIAQWTGSAWNAMVSPALSLRAVSAAGNVAYAGGQGLFQLGTGGSWAPVLLSGLEGEIVAIDLLASNSGHFATSAGQVWRLSGTTWTLATTAPAPLRDMDARALNDVVAVSEAGVWRWAQGAWTGTPLDGGPEQVQLVGSDDGWVLGSVVHRFDGQSWAPAALPPGGATFTAVGARGANEAWLVSRDLLLRFVAGGYDAFAVGAAPMTALALQGGTAWAGDAKGRLFADDGAGWEFRGILSDVAITALAFAPDGTGYAADVGGGLHRHDGTAWRPRVDAAPLPLRAVAWSGAAWWAAGDAGILLRYDPEMDRFSPVVSGTTQRLHALAFAGPDLGYAVGVGGTIVKWNGASWLRVTSGTTADLHGIALLSGTEGFAVGDGKIVRLRTTGWQLWSSPIANLRAVAWRSPAEAWAVGLGGQMWRWNGAGWYAHASPVVRDLHTVAFQGPSMGAAAGDRATFVGFESVPCLVAAFSVPQVVEGVPAPFLDVSTRTPPDRIVSWQWFFGDGGVSYEEAPARAYQNQGGYYVTLRVVDDDGRVATSARWIGVNDVHPVPHLAPIAGPLVEGAPISFDGSGSAGANAADTLRRVEWDFHYVNGIFDVQSTASKPTWTFPQQGTFTVALRAWDEDSSAIATTVVTVLDAVPTANAGPDLAVLEGAPLVLSGAASTATPHDPIAAYAWDLAYDGVTFDVDATGIAPTVSFADQAVRTVALRVTDEDGSTSIDTLVVTIHDAVPTASAGADLVVVEGAPMALDGGASTASPADPIGLYEWDLAYDGATFTPSLQGRTVVATFPQQGVRTVALRVTDEDGSVALDTLLATVTDTAPTPRFTLPATALEGEPVTVDGRASSAYDGIAGHAWDFDPSGAFQPDATGPTAAYAFPQQGLREVVLRVTDGDGTRSDLRLALEVLDASPVFSLTGPDTLREEEPGTWRVAVTPNPADPVTRIEWDVDHDGETFTVDAVGAELTHAYPLRGDRVLAVRVHDEDGAVLATFAVSVLDLGPTAVAGPDVQIVEGASVRFDGTGSRAPAADPIQLFEWDLDHDGETFSVDATGPSVDHVYGEQGTFRVALRVTDGDGVATIATLLATVLDSVPQADAGPADVSIRACLDLHLSGAASVAPIDDPIVAFQWDLDYNGSFNVDAEGVDVTVACRQVGTFQVALRVLDEDHSMSIDVVNVTVERRFVLLGPEDEEGAGGREEQRNFTLVNLGAEVLVANLTAVASGGAAAEVEPEVTVGPESAVNVTVRVRIPADAEGGSRIHVRLVANLTICDLTDDNDTEIPVPPTHGIRVRVLGEKSQELELADRVLAARYVVEVSNFGNVAEDVDLRLVTDDGWPAALDRTFVRLPKFSATLVELTVGRPLSAAHEPVAVVAIVGTARSFPVESSDATATSYRFTYALGPRTNELTLILDDPSLRSARALATDIASDTGIDVLQVSRWDASRQRYLAWTPQSPSFVDLALAPGDAVRVWLRPSDPDWAGRATVPWVLRGSPLHVLQVDLVPGVTEFGWASIAEITASGLAAAVETRTGIPIEGVQWWDATRQDWRTFAVGSAVNDFPLQPGRGYRLVTDPDAPAWAERSSAPFAYDAWVGFQDAPPSPPASFVWSSPAWVQAAPDVLVDDPARWAAPREGRDEP